MKKIYLLCFLSISFSVFAQKNKPKTEILPNYTKASERLASFKNRQELQKNSLFKNLPFQNIGATIMSGRVVDMDINPTDPSIFLAAYASGGLWLTTSNGTDFSPIFDQEAVMTIGDIAVKWENNRPKTIFVGTGENNSSRSSYSGAGLYKSTDEGKNWQHLGLEETHHIGKVLLHPTDENTIWVASIGHLYSQNSERGVFKSTDGGKTWQKTLFINENTGVIDLVINPQNPNILYAAAWERSRRAWDFEENGKNSGIYKSTDGGNTWTKLSGGFPQSEGVGRIGLAISPKNPETLYAILDNQDKRETKEEKKEEAKITKELLKKITKDDFLKLSEDDINDFLDKNDFPMQYTAQNILEKVRKNEITPISLVDFLQNANDDLFETPIKGYEVYKTENGGQTWQKTHEGFIDNLIYTYGYYFGQIQVSPHSDKELYILGVPVLKSEDGGKNWKNINGENVHVDHHYIWINPSRKGHLILGNDGGVNISYNDGKDWLKLNTIPVGQFYAVNVDMAEPFNVYGGLQDNGVWWAAHTYKFSDDWQQEGKYPYQNLMGGDGMQIEIDTRDNNTVYTGYQFGNYFRIDKSTGKTKYITPTHILGEKPFRFNWQTPIHLSRHNQDILYMASNRFHRSMNKGETFETLSPDLTKGEKTGNVPYGTLTSIDESPKKFGLIYVGSDDGLVHVSKDGGYNWSKISDNLPQNFWVSRVDASAHQEGRVYVSLNGYRFDNFEALVYVSEDYGKNWTQIGKNLPKEPVNVVKEDPNNENIVYVGTDHALYASVDKGKNFMILGNLPAVAVHDLVVQARDKKLVVGTHGRSLYLTDVQYLEAFTPEILAKKLHFFEFKKITFTKNWGKSGGWWSDVNETKINLPIYVSESGKAKIEILEKDQVLKTFEADLEKGLNFVLYDLSTEKAVKDAQKAENGKFYLVAGEYSLKISVGTETMTQNLVVEPAKERPSRKAKKKTP